MSRTGDASGAIRSGDPGSYTRKRIEVTFRLGAAASAAGTPAAGATFEGTGGANAVTLSGLRCSATITKAGGISQGALDLRVWGMTPDLMNKLSQVGRVPLDVQRGNTVTVSAGAEGDALAIAYQGTVSAALADYSAAPDVPFQILGLAALEVALMSVPPSSYRGGADVAVVMADLARIMGKRFENGGVSGIVLRDPYFPGSAYQQAETCAEAAGIDMALDDGVLAIWPRGGSRGGAVPLISPDTGMIGYPVPTNIGVEVMTLWNPAVTFGAKVEVRSPTVPQANGVWQVKGLEHKLESELPDGAWWSQLSCVRLGYISS